PPPSRSGGPGSAARATERVDHCEDRRGGRDMDAAAAAEATATAVSTVGSHFMLDAATYGRGAELGFQGIDFYVTGRGGVLGDVDADVVSATFGFFEPGQVRTLWDQGRA